jgi:Gram-negative bacterial TonB protein C-terminal
VVLDKTMRVPLGQRTVFARQSAPSGPMYVVVVAAPLPPGGSPRAMGAQVVEPSPLIRAPRLLSGSDLVLPPEARTAGLKERIVLTATVGTDGLARDINIVQPPQGLSERLKEWAVQALKQRRYEPARDGTGTPMEVQIVVTIPLRDGPDEE